MRALGVTKLEETDLSGTNVRRSVDVGDVDFRMTPVHFRTFRFEIG
jgi:hypothetical protein